MHVLGLPLAFILSQDQTLHCKRCSIWFVFDEVSLCGPPFGEHKDTCCSQNGQYVKELYRMGPKPLLGQLEFTAPPAKGPSPWLETDGKSNMPFRILQHGGGELIHTPCSSLPSPSPRGGASKNVSPKAAANVRGFSKPPNIGRKIFQSPPPSLMVCLPPWAAPCRCTAHAPPARSAPHTHPWPEQ